MAKIAIISDIHANLDALLKVEEDWIQEGCTEVVCLGDVVGYNAYPQECVNEIRRLGCLVVKGNHDEEVAMPTENSSRMNPVAWQAMEWTRSQLDEDSLQWLARLQYQRAVRTSTGRTFTIVHSTLDQPKAWNYVINEHDAAANFIRQFSQLCFHGHTHIPLIFRWDGKHAEKHDDAIDELYMQQKTTFELEAGKKYFVNVGSVGQPRDTRSEASYGIFDPERNLVTIKRVAYDVKNAQNAILAAGLPEYLANRLEQGF